MHFALADSRFLPTASGFCTVNLYFIKGLVYKPILHGTQLHLTCKCGSKNTVPVTGPSMLAYVMLHLIYTYITLEELCKEERLIKWILPSTRVIRNEENTSSK